MSDDPGDDGQPSAFLVAHLGGAAGALLAGVAGAPLILLGTADGGATVAGFLLSGAYVAGMTLLAVFIVHRGLGRALPANLLGLDDPPHLGWPRQARFVSAARRGEPDEVADYLDDLRSLDDPDVRPWQPGADVPEDRGQAAYREIQELERSAKRRLGRLGALAAAVFGSGIAGVWFVGGPLGVALGGTTAVIVHLIWTVALPLLIVGAAFPGIVRSWTLWYRDHVVEG